MKNQNTKWRFEIDPFINNAEDPDTDNCVTLNIYYNTQTNPQCVEGITVSTNLTIADVLELCIETLENYDILV